MIKREFDKAFVDVKSYLEEDNHNELSEAYEEASNFISRYNTALDLLDTVLDEPSSYSFALALARKPLTSWRELDYCQAFSSIDYDVKEFTG